MAAGTNIINILLYIAGAVLIASVIIHSITLIASRGNEAPLTAAKKGLTNAAIGILVVPLVFVIMNGIVTFALSREL